MKSLLTVWTILFITGAMGTGHSAEPDTPPPGDHKVTFSGGHETDPRDRGRPVVLIAAALGVEPEVFREAFSHVTPAVGGAHPEPRQVQMNKKALLDALVPYGVTNERLDEVSNYYRYNPGAGGIWKSVQAEAVAVVANGQVTSLKLTNPGAGYTVPPEVTVAGAPNLKVKATLRFTKDLKTNGSISELTILK